MTQAFTPSTPPRKEREPTLLTNPLLAVMVYKGYYKTIFLKSPQKEVSSYITGLWTGEHFRNKWALIAKVYSFVRDELDQTDISLKEFLEIACPIMLVVPPANYLDALGWVRGHDANGASFIVQDKTVAQNLITAIESQDSPDTELDLLLRCLASGYMADHADYLAAKLSAKSDAIMTPTLVASNTTGPRESSAAARNATAAATEAFQASYFQPMVSSGIGGNSNFGILQAEQLMAHVAGTDLQMQDMGFTG